uniref:Putative secreted protein n=1 Tax=Aedes aegypti TaxID=7159 RepID=Q1I1C0_AEDAE|nr:putative secreted protein precursor [Aedes aegypti]
MKLLILSVLVLVATIHVTAGFRIFNPWWNQPSNLCRNVTEDGSPQPENGAPWWWRFIPLPPCHHPASNSSGSANGTGHWDSHQGNNSWSNSWSSNDGNHNYTH